MYEINFNQKQHVHFTGIGGISMSALAEILLSKGFIVSGSDSRESELTDRLTGLGATIVYEQTAKNITNNIDFLVYTAAVKNDNPELVKARELSIPTLTRAEFLGQLMRTYESAICISGTHGKTTVTSMISQILLESTDPTILVGGVLNAINGNAHIGSSGIMVNESCEYTNSFLSFYPTTAIILNVREDHMDFFKDINDIRNSFKKFAGLVPEDGTVIINTEIDDFSYFTNNLKCRVITYGKSSDAEYTAANISYNSVACAEFDVIHNGKCEAHITLGVPGEHNVYNSLAAIAACRDKDVEYSNIIEGLHKYSGTDRRFQYKGTAGGVTIIDDYAHHPDEIEATLKTAKSCKYNTLWCLFQPHTFTRTKAFMKDFARALSLADKVILADIYPARETDNLGISSETLLAEVKKTGCEAYYFSDFEDIKKFILKNCINGDLLITMGAGNIQIVGEELLEQ